MFLIDVALRLLSSKLLISFMSDLGSLSFSKVISIVFFFGSFNFVINFMSNTLVVKPVLFRIFLSFSLSKISFFKSDVIQGACLAQKLSRFKGA